MLCLPCGKAATNLKNAWVGTKIRVLNKKEN